MRLVDVPWDLALVILLDTNGLGCERKNNVVRISTIGRLSQEKDDRRRNKEAGEAEEEIQASYLNVNYAKVADLETKIKGILSDRGSVISDERTNTLIIRDIKKNVDNVNEVVRRLDTRTPQVLIESNLIETSPSFAMSLGMELGFSAPSVNRSSTGLVPRAGLLGDAPENKEDQDKAIGGLFTRGVDLGSAAAAAAPFSGALGLTFSVIQDRVGVFRNIRAVLSAAESEGNLKIISRPSIVTLNNETSTISSLRIIRISLPTGTTNIASGSGSAAGSAVATETVNVGITLSVTPQVSSDGFVLMNISVKSSSIATNTLGGSVVPFDELSREALSNVLVRDGETVVIGGIMKDTRARNEGGVPYLKDIPVIGWLFKNILLQKDFEELMIFITPRIIRGGAQDLPSAEQLWRDAYKKTKGG